MEHVNSRYISGLLKPCTRLSTPLSSIIVKTDNNFFLTRYFFEIPVTYSNDKYYYILGFKHLAQWEN